MDAYCRINLLNGVKYGYYTTREGAMEKEDPDNWEFVVPAN